jgi:hypothetical protein
VEQIGLLRQAIAGRDPVSELRASDRGLASGNRAGDTQALFEQLQVAAENERRKAEAVDAARTAEAEAAKRKLDTALQTIDKGLKLLHAVNSFTEWTRASGYGSNFRVISISPVILAGSNEAKDICRECIARIIHP